MSIDSLNATLIERISELEAELATLRAAKAALDGSDKTYLKGAVEFARKNYTTKRVKRNAIDDDLKEAILDMTDEGLKPSEIAEVLKIDVTIVYSVRSAAVRAAA